MANYIHIKIILNVLSVPRLTVFRMKALHSERIDEGSVFCSDIQTAAGVYSVAPRWYKKEGQNIGNISPCDVIQPNQVNATTNYIRQHDGWNNLSLKQCQQKLNNAISMNGGLKPNSNSDSDQINWRLSVHSKHLNLTEKVILQPDSVWGPENRHFVYILDKETKLSIACRP